MNGAIHKPFFPGEETFSGTIIHSSEYRIPEVYKDKIVLIVGSRISMWEVHYDIRNHVKQVTCSKSSIHILYIIRV